MKITILKQQIGGETSLKSGSELVVKLAKSQTDKGAKRPATITTILGLSADRDFFKP